MSPTKDNDNHLRTWPEVAGFILIHPRTWILVVAFALAWRCYGVAEWFHGHLTQTEAEASEEARHP